MWLSRATRALHRGRGSGGSRSDAMMHLLEGVHHELRGVGHVVPELRVLLRGELRRVEARAEVDEPVLCRDRSDLERGVSHPQPRMAPPVRVRRGTTPVLLQEKGESLLRRAEVLLRVER